jgi:hypothetical protein
MKSFGMEISTIGIRVIFASSEARAAGAQLVAVCAALIYCTGELKGILILTLGVK